MPCKQNGCSKRGRKACAQCSDWIPSPKSRYYKCVRFLANRITCQEPPGTCAKCEYRIPKRGRGRPAVIGVEMPPVKNRKEYAREYMRGYMRLLRNAAGLC